MTDRGEEARFFWKCTGVGDYGRCVHLEAVVVVKTERFVLDDTLVKFETGLFEAFAATRMTAIEYRHVIFFSNGVDGVEKAEEVLLCVDVFFAVGREKNVLAFFETETLVYVACLDVGEVLVEYFRHWRAGNICAFFRQTAVSKITAGVFRVAEVHIVSLKPKSAPTSPY